MPPEGLDDLFNQLNKEQEQKNNFREGFKAMHTVYTNLIEAGFSKDEAITFIVKLSTK